MNSNIKIIIIVIISLLIGLGIGYFIASNNSQIPLPETEHVHTAVENQIWTCAMHPQIRQNEPGLCPICEMELIPLENNTSQNPMVLEMTNEAVKLANIQTSIVGQQTGDSKTLFLSGKIKTDERRISTQTAHIPGRIEKLFVTFTGEKVTKGQIIATIYSPEFVAAQRELIEAKKLKATNPNLLDAARKKLQHWKISKTVIDSIENSETVTTLIDIHADASGVVSNLQVAVGEHFMEGSVLFDIVNLNRLWVLFDAYEEDLAHIRLGNKISFTTPALPDKTFSTTVSYIDPVIDPNTRTASIRSEINNSSGILKPEMFVKGTLINVKKSKNKQQLSVPKTAVLWTGKRSVVYVKVPDSAIPSFEFREIEIGDAIGENYEILNGLEAGEEVVTYGSFTIDAAAQLNNQVSMMNKYVMLKGADHSEHLPDYTESTPIEFKQQLVNVSDAYLQLKDALVETDKDKAAATAKQLSEALTFVDMALVKGNAHMYWMDQLKAIQAHNEKISSLDDVEEQRKQFDFLSQSLINSIKVFGLPNDTLYVLHCPMANDNNGADWISKEKEIQNPYYGDKMLTCGSVTEMITKDFKNSPMEKITNAPKMSGHNH